MSTPPLDNGPADERGRRLSRQTQLILLTATLLVVIAAIVVIVLLLGSGDGTNENGDSGETTVDMTGVTSPYDLFELPADVGPEDVDKASLVSISLTATGDIADYYGLSADTEPAKALIKAVSDAEELDTDDIPSTTETIVSDDQPPVSTLTFLFPDRTTLAFELDIDRGTITRGGRVWQVDGDLAVLIDAATSLHERQ